MHDRTATPFGVYGRCLAASMQAKRRQKGFGHGSEDSAGRCCRLNEINFSGGL